MHKKNLKHLTIALFMGLVLVQPLLDNRQAVN